MSKNKGKTEYEKLRDEWYKKLKDEGFEDQEQNELWLKSWSTKFVNGHSQVTRESKEEYYRIATHFLNDYAFESQLERTIWEYHAEGISIRDIVGLLKKVGIKEIGTRNNDRNTVWAIVHKLETAMKRLYLSDYTERQNS